MLASPRRRAPRAAPACRRRCAFTAARSSSVSDDALAQAGRAAAVVHRLAHVEVVHRLHRVVLGHHALQEAPRGAASRGSHRARRSPCVPSGSVEHLRVERVGRHRVRHRQLRPRWPARSGSPRPASRAASASSARGVDEGQLVQHQEAAVAHRQHVGVEGARVDARPGAAAGRGTCVRIELVQPRQRLARLQRLPRREALGPRRLSARRCGPRRRGAPPARPGSTSRVWFAAPSSAKWPPPGSGACTAKRRSSAKMARSTACVVSASIARWNICWRLAGVRCIRPSAVSARRRARWPRWPSTSPRRWSTAAAGARPRARRG